MVISLFASVLLHEFLWNGIDVKKITLFIFGGVAQIESEPKLQARQFLLGEVNLLLFL